MLYERRGRTHRIVRMRVIEPSSASMAALIAMKDGKQSVAVASSLAAATAVSETELVGDGGDVLSECNAHESEASGDNGSTGSRSPE